MSHAVSSPVPVTLDELVALNDEIAALVRAGVPLELGLGRLGRDLPGRLGKVTQAIAADMERGRSLEEAIDDPGLGVPAVYRAVVKAGLRGGRLGPALESLANSARRVAQTRRSVAGAFVYPLFVALLAWGLAVFYVLQVAPNFLAAFEAFDVPGREWLAALVACGPSVAWWAPWVPLVLVVLAVCWWRGSGRAAVLGPSGSGRSLGWLPGLGSLLRQARVANFAELLALQVENRVPLDEAIVLAAEAAGDRGLAESAREAAAALRSGQSAPNLPAHRWPPMLAWALATGGRLGNLPAVLRRTAETCRRRVDDRLRWLQVSMPVVATVVVGGTATAAYVSIVFLPWLTLLYSLVK